MSKGWSPCKWSTLRVYFLSRICYHAKIMPLKSFLLPVFLIWHHESKWAHNTVIQVLTVLPYFLAQRAAAQQSHNDVYNPVEQHQYVPQSLVVGTSSGNTAINLASHNNDRYHVQNPMSMVMSADGLGLNYQHSGHVIHHGNELHYQPPATHLMDPRQQQLYLLHQVQWDPEYRTLKTSINLTRNFLVSSKMYLCPPSLVNSGQL